MDAQNEVLQGSSTIAAEVAEKSKELENAVLRLASILALEPANLIESLNWQMPTDQFMHFKKLRFGWIKRKFYADASIVVNAKYFTLYSWYHFYFCANKPFH